MRSKKIIFSLFSLILLQISELNAALAQSQVFLTAHRALSVVAPLHFSCQCFAGQGIQLPLCQAKETELWQKILSDPDLMDQQPQANWKKWTLPAMGISAIGATACYLRKQRKQQENITTSDCQFIPVSTAMATQTDNVTTQTVQTSTPTKSQSAKAETLWWKHSSALPTTVIETIAKKPALKAQNQTRFTETANIGTNTNPEPKTCNPTPRSPQTTLVGHQDLSAESGFDISPWPSQPATGRRTPDSSTNPTQESVLRQWNDKLFRMLYIQSITITDTPRTPPVAAIDTPRTLPVAAIATSNESRTPPPLTIIPVATVPTVPRNFERPTRNPKPTKNTHEAAVIISAEEAINSGNIASATGTIQNLIRSLPEYNQLKDNASTTSLRRKIKDLCVAYQTKFGIPFKPAFVLKK